MGHVWPPKGNFEELSFRHEFLGVRCRYCVKHLLKHLTDPEPTAVTDMFCGFVHQAFASVTF